MQGGSVSVASPRPALTPAEPIERAAPGAGREIDLVAVALLLWARRWWLLLAIAIGTAAAAAYAFTTPKTWRAEVVTTQVHEQQMGGAAASLANQLGGLVSLTGLGNIGADRDEQDYQAVLQSRHLLEEFIVRNDLLERLWPDPRTRPTLWRAVRRFENGVVSIREDPRRGITTLSVEWTDPATAASWANGLVALANELIRTRALTEAQRNIAYLSAQAERTGDVDLRHVIFSLIENQTKTEMLANGRPEYAFRIVDPARVPEIRAAPHRTLLLITGFMLGAVLGALFILAWDWVRRQRERLRRGAP
jgi:LPS O-antigen subunit length determinant protein (WzzB/FepE family)